MVCCALTEQVPAKSNAVIVRFIKTIVKYTLQIHLRCKAYLTKSGLRVFGFLLAGATQKRPCLKPSLTVSPTSVWVEVRHRDKGGAWWSSVRACDDMPEGPWLFDVTDVQVLGTVQGWNAVELSCELALPMARSDEGQDWVSLEVTGLTVAVPRWARIATLRATMPPQGLPFPPRLHKQSGLVFWELKKTKIWAKCNLRSLWHCWFSIP